MYDLLEGIGDGLLVRNGDFLTGELPVVVRCDDAGHFFLGRKTELASTGKTEVVGVATLRGRDAAKDVNEHDSLRRLEARVHAEPDGDEGGTSVAGILGVARTGARVAAWQCYTAGLSGATAAAALLFLLVVVLVVLLIVILVLLVVVVVVVLLKAAGTVGLLVVILLD